MTGSTEETAGETVSNDILKGWDTVDTLNQSSSYITASAVSRVHEPRN